ncbi:uncharacterized protein LOC133323939, partial [Musca vetustissima]|uniref:uncharacterized protein LOC133323939 n=1 Tax=Musca vetustissima TaxID=27455 RepID=UPI002AB668CB
MKSISMLVFFCVPLTTVYAITLRFTNLQCQAFHPEFAKFAKCRLKVVKRGVISLNINVELYQVPVTNATHNIIVDNLILYEDVLKYFPLPHGDYMIQLKVAAYNDWKADVRTYITLTNDFG